MENINVAIVTGNREYGRALGLALLNVCRTLVINLFDKDGFTDRNGQEGTGFDLVLWDGCEEAPWENTVYLVDKPSLACRDSVTGHRRVYKYNPAQQMVSDIFDAYSSITGRRPPKVAAGNVHVYAFCAWAGGTGCSTVAMAVSQELMRFHGDRVLYLSLEELESTGSFIKGTASARTMGYYLYNLFKGKQTGGLAVAENTTEYRPFMESFTVRDDFGVEAFRPTKGRNPLVDLDSDEICTFIESVMNSGRYDCIVIDTGTGLSAAALTCLEMAERICLVTKYTGSIARETCYLQYLMAIGGEDMIRKMVKIANMTDRFGYEAFAEDSMDREDSMIDTFMSIKRDNIYSEEGAITKVLLEGNFGNNISKLTNKLIEPLR